VDTVVAPSPLPRPETGRVLSFIAAEARRSRPLAVALDRATTDRLAGSLVVDWGGTVVSCTLSLAHRIGTVADAIVGRPLGDVLPGATVARLAAQCDDLIEPPFGRAPRGSAPPANGAPVDGQRRSSARGPLPAAQRLATAGRGPLAVDLVCGTRTMRGVRVLGIDVWLRDRMTELALERLVDDAEAADEIVLLTDRCGTIEYANPAFARRSGFQRAALTGRNVATLRFDGVGERSPAWASVRAGVAWYGVFVPHGRDGKFFQLALRIRPFADRGGPITHFVCVGRDPARR
jgi:PAS domain S-box-containing protein